MSKFYRIACVFPSIYLGGGSEMVVFNVARAFRQAGHSVVFFSLLPPTFTWPLDLPTSKTLPAYCQKFPKIFQVWKLRRLIREEERRHGDFDLILSNLHTRKPLVFKHPNRLFYYLHLINPDEKSGKSKRFSRYYHDKQVIAVSEGIKTEFLQLPEVHPASVTTIYNGFDFARIQEQANAFKPRIDEPYIIHVGRFDPQKRHDVLFEAYRRLKNPPKLVLLVQVTEELKRLIAHYDLSNRVLLPGLQSNPFPWIKQAKALILSSDFEAFGNVLLESLICGTPVVSTDCPSGPNEILKGDLAHWLSPVNDPIALASKIQEVLEHPYSVNVEQLRRFDIKIVLIQYLTLIKDSS